MSMRGGYNTPQGDFDNEERDDPLATELQQARIEIEDLKEQVAKLEIQLERQAETHGREQRMARLKFTELRQAIESELRNY